MRMGAGFGAAGADNPTEAEAGADNIPNRRPAAAAGVGAGVGAGVAEEEVVAVEPSLTTRG